MEAEPNCKQSRFKELESMVLWVAVTAYLDYKPRYGSVLLRAFLMDRLPKALPGIDYQTREQLFNSLVSQGFIQTRMVKGPHGKMVVVFTPNEKNADVQQLLQELVACN